MATWRETILAKLANYTGYEVDVGEDHIVVSCGNPESFGVSIYESGDDFRVGFDGWHEHFGAEEDALNCFAFGLSEECRLKVVKRGNTECSWTVQALQDGTWVDDTTTKLIFVPFWRLKQVVYRQNSITKVET